jgi:hypothetical protein
MQRIKPYFSSASTLMSKLKELFLALLIGGFVANFYASVVAAQDIAVQLKISSNSTLVEVEGTYLSKNRFKYPRNVSFTGFPSTVDHDVERISGLQLFDENDQAVPTRKLNSREYLAEADVKKLKYAIDIKPTGNFTDKAHVSWVERGNGIIMLRDLLPEIVSVDGKSLSAVIRISLPLNWTVNSSIMPTKSGEFEVSDFEKSIFVIGNSWRKHRVAVGEINVNLEIFGEWQFADEEAVKLIAEVLPELKQSFGEYPGKEFQIILIPLQNKFGRWEAETRGNSVTIVSGDMMFKKPSIQRLHEQLRHEMLHLWIPNRLTLTGNYDWFYEGFSIYQSLRIGVAMNRLSFDNFLETIADAYRISNSNALQISLINSSKATASGMNRQVYAKGMVVAFLCDIAILSKSGGKRSVSDIFSKVYRKHRLPNASQDGNIAILNILGEYPELRSIVQNYIEGEKAIDLREYLDLLGIEEKSAESSVQLKVLPKLKGRQKDLLDSLGYNEWRKIGKDSK